MWNLETVLFSEHPVSRYTWRMLVPIENKRQRGCDIREAMTTDDVS